MDLTKSDKVMYTIAFHFDSPSQSNVLLPLLGQVCEEIWTDMSVIYGFFLKI